MADAGQSSRRAALSAAAATMIVLIVLAGAVVAVHLTARAWVRPVWLASCLSGRMFLVTALATLVCGVLLVAVVGFLVRAGAACKPRPAAQEGTAMLEFALALPIALILVMIMAQSALLMVGNVCVHYASYCAARAAIVTVPVATGYQQMGNWSQPEGWNEISDLKLQRIKAAAVWAVLPVSCSTTDVAESADASTLKTGLSSFFTRYGAAEAPYWVTAHLGRKLGYAQNHTWVDAVPPAAEGRYTPREDIEVRVRHDFYMAIPYANRLYAEFFPSEAVSLPFGQNEWAMAMYATCRLTNEGEPTFVDIETFPQPNN